MLHDVGLTWISIKRQKFMCLRRGEATVCSIGKTRNLIRLKLTLEKNKNVNHNTEWKSKETRDEK